MPRDFIGSRDVDLGRDADDPSVEVYDAVSVMQERRATPRRRVDEDGDIAIDEHTKLACLIYDRSETGVRLTMLDTAPVPETFVLTIHGLGEFRVCVAAWRTAEEIGARFDPAGDLRASVP